MAEKSLEGVSAMVLDDPDSALRSLTERREALSAAREKHLTFQRSHVARGLMSGTDLSREQAEDARLEYEYAWASFLEATRRHEAHQSLALAKSNTDIAQTLKWVTVCVAAATVVQAVAAIVQILK
jgi:hypothetical protein